MSKIKRPTEQTLATCPVSQEPLGGFVGYLEDVRLARVFFTLNASDNPVAWISSVISFERRYDQMRSIVITEDWELHEHGIGSQGLRSRELLCFDNDGFLAVLCHCLGFYVVLC